DDRRENRFDAVFAKLRARAMQLVSGEIVFVKIDPAIAVHLQVKIHKYNLPRRHGDTEARLEFERASVSGFPRSGRSSSVVNSFLKEAKKSRDRGRSSCRRAAAKSIPAPAASPGLRDISSPHRPC